MKLQSFIRQIGAKVEKNMLITAIINMGHTLVLWVVAEGVEIEELSFIEKRGCGVGQSYYFNKPLRPSFFAQRLLLVKNV